METIRLFLVLWAICFSAVGATYYVDPVNGNNANAGTNIAAPLQTIYYATRHFPFYITNGDTVILRGGIYYGATNAIDIGNGIGYSGSPGSPITIKAYPGEVPIISGMANTDSVGGYAVNLKFKSYWTFSDLIYSNNTCSMAFNGCTNIMLTNCVYTKMPDDSTNMANHNYSAGCILFQTSCQSNTVINCTVTNWGTGFTNVNSANQWMVAGSPIIWAGFGPFSGGPTNYNEYSMYNLIQGCTFAHCGHDLMGALGAFNTYRSNIFYNDAFRPTNTFVGWQYYNFGNVRTENNILGVWGSRLQKTGSGDNDFTALGTNLNTVDQRQLWEYNTFLYGSFPADSAEASGLGICTRLGIYRFNTVSYCMGSGLYFLPGASAVGAPADTNNPAFYHSGMVVQPDPTRASMSTLNCIYGNTIFGNGTLVPLGVSTIRFPIGGISINNGVSNVVNNYLVNNIFWNNSPSDLATINGQESPTNAQVWRTNYCMDYGLPYPQFLGTNGFGYVYSVASLPDLRLNTNSPCIDRGDWLTTATGSSNGTVMQVFNSLYFSDGNHMIPGDVIQLQGQTVTSRVLVNDWTNNVLTLDSSLTWTNGQGVSLVYSGSAPDMGAFEFAPPAPYAFSGSFMMSGPFTLR